MLYILRKCLSGDIYAVMAGVMSPKTRVPCFRKHMNENAKSQNTSRNEVILSISPIVTLGAAQMVQLRAATESSIKNLRNRAKISHKKPELPRTQATRCRFFGCLRRNLFGRLFASCLLYCNILKIEYHTLTLEKTKCVIKSQLWFV